MSQDQSLERASGRSPTLLHAERRRGRRLGLACSRGAEALRQRLCSGGVYRAGASKRADSSSRREAYWPLQVHTTLSRSGTPRSAPALASLRVTSRSSGLGEGSSEGWLWPQCVRCRYVTLSVQPSRRALRRAPGRFRYHTTAGGRGTISQPRCRGQGRLSDAHRGGVLLWISELREGVVLPRLVSRACSRYAKA